MAGFPRRWRPVVLPDLASDGASGPGPDCALSSPEEFSVAVGFRDGFRIAVVRGEVDEHTTPALDSLLNEPGRNRAVIVDLSMVAFMSSAGVHVLLRERPTPVALVCRQGIVSRLFDLVGANRRIPIFDTLDHAIQSLSLSIGETSAA